MLEIEGFDTFSMQDNLLNVSKNEVFNTIVYICYHLVIVVYFIVVRHCHGNKLCTIKNLTNIFAIISLKMFLNFKTVKIFPNFLKFQFFICDLVNFFIDCTSHMLLF